MICCFHYEFSQRGIYNNMYKKLINDETLSNPMARYNVQIFDLSALGGKYEDVRLDPETIDMLFDAFKAMLLATVSEPGA